MTPTTPSSPRCFNNEHRFTDPQVLTISPLLNATLYFGLFIASLYSFVFPVFLMVGSKPGWSFHVINYWAHLWMGATAAFTPVFFDRIWPRLRPGTRVGAAAGLALVWLAPYAF